AGKEGYTAMAGGLCRTSSEAGNFVISNQLGGISKDAWVLTPEPGRILNVLKEPTERMTVSYNDMLPSHAAENLFWVGRYTERVLGNARFLRTVMQFVVEGNKLRTENNILTERCLLTALTQYSYTYPGFIGDGAEERVAAPWKELTEVLFNEKRAGSLKHNFQQFYKAVHEVREHWSTDTWRVLRSIEEEFRLELSLSGHGRLQMLHTLDDLITAIVAFIGLNRESISREQGWIMLDVGRKIEQSLLLITLIRTMLIIRWNEQIEYNLLQSILMSCEGLVNYRYKYRMPLQHSLVLDFLLFDPHNPRSLVYQVERLKAYLKELPRAGGGPLRMEYERLIDQAVDLLKQPDRKALEETDAGGVSYQELEIYLSSLYALLSAIPGVISKTYFKHEQAPKTLISRG
ncbi:MAG TPA: circularly permuted type 2 ATP-grasp protein, partial [Puia sp.]|nr:circularly permuted type 2 ATP-grasp protein [Puia sp.]